MQLDLLLTLFNVVARIVAFVPNALFVDRFCIEITVKPFSMVFSLQSEKCVKAVEGHTYYNKTKERNNRASILKSPDIQHIIASVISVRIRVAEGRRHLNPAAPFSIHNERDVGVLFPSPFLPLRVAHPEWSLENTPLCQPTAEANVQFVGICSGTPGRELAQRGLTPPLICSQARLWVLQPPSPISTVQMFLPGACDWSQIKWQNNQIPPVKTQLFPTPQQTKCLGGGHKTEEKESRGVSHYSFFLSPGP